MENTVRSVLPLKLGGFIGISGPFNFSVTNNDGNHYVESGLQGPTIGFQTQQQLCTTEDGIQQNGVFANNRFWWDGTAYLDTLVLVIGIENEYTRPMQFVLQNNTFDVNMSKSNTNPMNTTLTRFTYFTCSG